jgi:hypothetical protein
MIVIGIDFLVGRANRQKVICAWKFGSEPRADGEYTGLRVLRRPNHSTHNHRDSNVIFDHPVHLGGLKQVVSQPKIRQ